MFSVEIRNRMDDKSPIITAQFDDVENVMQFMEQFQGDHFKIGYKGEEENGYETIYNDYPRDLEDVEYAIVLRTDKKRNVEYWDDIDGEIAKFVRYIRDSFALISVENSRSKEDIDREYDRDFGPAYIREVIKEELEKFGYELPYVDGEF